jgi:hypothetical protein
MFVLYGTIVPMPAFTPLNELPIPAQQEEIPGQPLYWGIDLGPYVDAERIQVHEGRLKRVLHVAGLSSLVVRDTILDQDKQQNDMPGVGGITADGAAIGVGGLRRRERKFADYDKRFQVTEAEKRLYPDYRWPAFNMSVDRATAGQAVVARNEKLKDRTKAWGLVLDHTVRKGLADASKANLFPMGTKHEKLNAIVGAMFASFHLSDSLAYAESIERGIRSQALTVGIYTFVCGTHMLLNKFSTGSSHFMDRRWSLSPMEAQPDRYLLARGMIATHKIIKVRQ